MTSLATVGLTGRRSLFSRRRWPAPSPARLRHCAGCGREPGLVRGRPPEAEQAVAAAVASRWAGLPRAGTYDQSPPAGLGSSPGSRQTGSLEGSR
jgi:hypothetical protein